MEPLLDVVRCRLNDMLVAPAARRKDGVDRVGALTFGRNGARVLTGLERGAVDQIQEPIVRTHDDVIDPPVGWLSKPQERNLDELARSQDLPSDPLRSQNQGTYISL